MNGCGGSTLSAYEGQKSMKAMIELLEMLSEAENDAAHGRMAFMQETFDELRALLKRESKQNSL